MRVTPLKKKKYIGERASSNSRGVATNETWKYGYARDISRFVSELELEWEWAWGFEDSVWELNMGYARFAAPFWWCLSIRQRFSEFCTYPGYLCPTYSHIVYTQCCCWWWYWADARPRCKMIYAVRRGTWAPWVFTGICGGAGVGEGVVDYVRERTNCRTNALFPEIMNSALCIRIRICTCKSWILRAISAIN